LIIVNVKTLIRLMLFLEKASGQPTYLVLAGNLVRVGTTLVIPTIATSFFNFIMTRKTDLLC